MQIEEEVATPAEPQHWPTLFQKPGVCRSGMPLASDAAGGLRRPLQPRAIPGGLPQPIPEPRRARGAVAPPEVIEATPGLVGLVVVDQAHVAVGLARSAFRYGGAGERAVEERALLRRLVERGQEVGDAGGAVREVGQQLRRRAVHRPFAAARLVAAALEQPASGARREGAGLGRVSASAA